MNRGSQSIATYGEVLQFDCTNRYFQLSSLPKGVIVEIIRNGRTSEMGDFLLSMIYWVPDLPTGRQAGYITYYIKQRCVEK